MTDQPQSPPPIAPAQPPATTPPPLQFDKAVYSAPGDLACVGCKRPITGTYFTINKKIVCPNCHAAVTQSHAPGTKWSRFFRALLLGLGGAILGAIFWYAVRTITGYEVGYVAVVVGLLVGFAVRKGSRNLGGRGYQFLALGLTWFSIAGQYMPIMYKVMMADIDKKHALHATTAPATTQAMNAPPMATTTPVATAAPVETTAPAATSADSPSPVSDRSSEEHGKIAKALHLRQMGIVGHILALLIALVLILLLLAAMPIIVAISEPFEFLMIGLALWQAWKINRKRVMAITGPHTLAAPTPG